MFFFVTRLYKCEPRSVFGLNPFLVEKFLWGNEDQAQKQQQQNNKEEEPRKYLDMAHFLFFFYSIHFLIEV